MKRIVLTFAAAGALAVLAAAPLAAEQRRGMGGEGGFAARRLGRCLDTLNLSTTQRADIDAAIAAAKPTLQADKQALRADRGKLKTDLDAGADKSVIGQDEINLNTDRQKLRADAMALRDQIASKLSTDQQNQLKGCFRGPHGRHNANPSNPAS